MLKTKEPDAMPGSFFIDWVAIDYILIVYLKSPVPTDTLFTINEIGRQTGLV